MPKESAEWAFNAWGDMRQWKVSDLEILLPWAQQPEDIKNMWRTTIRETLVRSHINENA